jgi:hypothetical protein
MLADRVLLGSSTVFAIVGVVFLANTDALAQGNYGCDPVNGVYQCSCVTVNSTTVCADMTQTQNLIYCTTSGTPPCQTNKVLQCPGANGRLGLGTCVGGWIPVAGSCGPWNFNSC